MASASEQPIDCDKSNPDAPPSGKVAEGIAAYPSPSARGALTIQSTDLDRLKPGKWFNDTLIDVAFKLAWDSLQDELRRKTYVFSTFFYGTLKTALDVSATPEAAHALVKRWTRAVDILDKDFVVLPLNLQKHWFLAIACFTARATSVGEETASGAYILVFDSLPGIISSYDNIASNIRTYLTEEWRSKRGSELPFTSMNMPLYVPVTPRQPNESDCGVYAVLNLEAFFRRVPRFGDAVVRERMSFTADDAAQKRESMIDFILELHTQQNLGSSFASDWRAKQAAAGVDFRHAAHGTDTEASTSQQQPPPLRPTLRRSARIRRPSRRNQFAQLKGGGTSIAPRASVMAGLPTREEQLCSVSKAWQAVAEKGRLLYSNYDEDIKWWKA
ncbi:hypothetical protein HPB50_006240 [Hyalomma asiaticum]|uniref:Uncharacterized protein n=1 Tax=Hyalomma asiaticum TaxID=266040 RepID=A0ACB7TFK5_HYAAI|nr:hypothetical protein HPB50_006240 [Hyalomma asiaticum]